MRMLNPRSCLPARYFHPEGFYSPEAFNDYKNHRWVFREVATIVMLLTVAHLAGRNFQERFACLMLTFGVWDIFYYVWLKVWLIGLRRYLTGTSCFWSLSVDRPCHRPVSISVLMIIFSILIVRLSDKGTAFSPKLVSLLLALAGTVLVLYSFMYDTGATLQSQMPKPYLYELLVIGDIFFIAAFLFSYFKTHRNSWWKDSGGQI